MLFLTPFTLSSLLNVNTKQVFRKEKKKWSEGNSELNQKYPKSPLIKKKDKKKKL